MKAFIQLTNNRSCLLRADEIKADYERGHITVSDGGRIQGVFVSSHTPLRGYSSQYELAELSGIHQVTISALEKGRNSGGNLDTIELLADALGLSIDEYAGHKVVKYRGKKE